MVSLAKWQQMTERLREGHCSPEIVQNVTTTESHFSHFFEPFDRATKASCKDMLIDYW